MLKTVILALSAFLLLSFTNPGNDITGKWKGSVEIPDGSGIIDVIFTFDVDKDKVIGGTLDTGMSLENIEDGKFKEDNDKVFTFTTFSEIAQETLDYLGTIKEDIITIDVIGYGMSIDLKKVKEDEE